MKSIAHAQGVRDRSSRSPSPSRRVTASMSAIARSAVASVSTPGVFVKRTPRAADRLDVDVVVADRDVGHDPQLLAGGVEERVVDAVVQHHDDRVRPADRGVELLRRERPVLLGDPDVGAGLAQRGERRLGQAAGDDDPGHAAGL